MYESITKLETMIYTIRNHRVMIDSDLAKLYKVETKVLNQAVKRNLERFPEDFLILPNISELADLRSQIVTLEGLSAYNPISKYTPFLFTENGVAMLSSVLKSKEAIQINILIMRTFTKLRSTLKSETETDQRITDLESSMQTTHKLFKVVFERLDKVDADVTPKLPAHRKKIGLKK